MSQQNAPTPSTPSTEQSDKVVELLRDGRIAMITTRTADGDLQARPMGIQRVDDDGRLWFFISRSSEQAQLVQAQPQVNVSVATGDSWVSVAGRATVTRDQAMIDELWSSMVDAWFENGKDDPDVGLLTVEAQSAEYWDSPGGRIATVISLVKSRVTGQPYEGDNAATEMP